MERIPESVPDGWINVSLPEVVVKRIDRRLKEDSTYRSRAEIVKAATLRFLDEKASS